MSPPSMASDKDAVMEDDSAATRARSMAVRAAILAEDARIRAKFPLLLAVSAQSGVALAIWIGSLVVMTGAAAGYLRGVIPAWVVIPVSAFAASLLHELEHDLIHNLYFQKLPFIQDVMFFGIWIAKLSINPWTRRGYHLHHHRRSGQPDDYEERLIGLGISNLPYRIALAVAPWTIALVTKKIEKDSGGKYHTLRGTPCSAERWLQRVDLFFVLSPTLAALAAAYGSKLALTFLVVWAGPNVLRHACIVLMSSYSHYYGDVTPGDVNQQNQILNHWTLLPFQIFCVNFGAEHVIHHFVVGQSFWMRHLCRKKAWAILEANGTRVNDFGAVFSRAQRYYYDPGADAKGKKAA